MAKVTKAALNRIGLQIVKLITAGDRSGAADLYMQAAQMRDEIGDVAGAAIARTWAKDLRLPPPTGKEDQSEDCASVTPPPYPAQPR